MNDVIHVPGSSGSESLQKAKQEQERLLERRSNIASEFYRNDKHRSKEDLRIQLEQVTQDLDESRAKLKLEYIRDAETKSPEPQVLSKIEEELKDIQEKNRLRDEKKDLFQAIAEGRPDSPEKVRKALSRGLRHNCVNSDLQTPLAFAAKMGRLDIVELLLKEKPVDREVRDKSGLTPLILAARAGHLGVVECLLNVRSECGLENVSYPIASDIIIMNSKGNKNQNSNRILPCVNIETPDNDRRTALSHAAEKGHTKILNILLKRGAMVNFQDCEKKTPLSWAASKGEKPTVEVLLETEDIKPNILDKYSRTALFWAAINGNIDTVQELLPHAENIEAKDVEEHT